MIKQVTSIVDRVTQAVELVLGLVLVSGCLVLIASIQASRDARMAEHALVRTLGGTRRLIGASLTAEFALLGAFAGLVAVVGAEFTVAMLQSQVFELSVRLHPWVWPVGPAFGAAIIVVVGLLGSRSLVNSPPMMVLRGVELGAAMTLEDLGNLGDFLGGIGVVVTLLYLAVQMRHNSEQLRQNTKAVQSAAYQTAAQSIREYNSLWVPNRELAEVMWAAHDGLDALDDVDIMRLAGLTQTMFRSFENVFEQYRAGMITAEQWQGWRTLLRTILQRGRPHREFWADGIHELYVSGFQQEVNSLLAEVDAETEPHD